VLVSVRRSAGAATTPARPHHPIITIASSIVPY
jgi:hypothetical protein